MTHQIYNSLYEKYGKVALSKQELAQELGMGLSTVSKLMAEGYGLPNYIKVGNSKNSRVLFPIDEVAKFLAQTVEVA
ncbi:helix-turn-helix transcriptional regulator [Sulfurimonas indica]|uniref:helix-turn-helix transcriptional regulator n=1 Tax=Sulfurimonas indica TaxID=2508707 RepID=UPI0012649D0C|nr:helix-turn-helix domain-containing protein [Sulfurimonas indica]